MNDAAHYRLWPKSFSISPFMGNAFMIPDAIIFAISQQNLSAGAQKRLAQSLSDASRIQTRLVRLEGSGDPLTLALDELVAEGYNSILVQPMGIPFPEALRVWLNGAIGHWLDRKSASIRPHVLIGGELADIADLAGFAVEASLAGSCHAKVADTSNTALGKPGWQNPPDFTHHIIVCTGARCNYRDSASLLLSLKAEIAQAGVGEKCLTTGTGCMFPCNKGPMVAVYPRGEWYHLPDAPSVARFVSTVLANDDTLHTHLIHTAKSASLVGASN